MDWNGLSEREQAEQIREMKVRTCAYMLSAAFGVVAMFCTVIGYMLLRGLPDYLEYRRSGELLDGRYYPFTDDVSMWLCIIADLICAALTILAAMFWVKKIRTLGKKLPAVIISAVISLITFAVSSLIFLQ